MRSTTVVNTRTVSRIQPTSYTASTRPRLAAESTMTWTTSSIRRRKLKGLDSVSWTRITISNNRHNKTAMPSPTSTNSSNSFTTILTTQALMTQDSMFRIRTTTWWRIMAFITVATEEDTILGVVPRPIATARRRFSLLSLETVRSRQVAEAEPLVSRTTTSRQRQRTHKTNRAKTRARAFSSPNSRSITNSNNNLRAIRLTPVNLASSSARYLKVLIRLKCKL